MADKSSIEWTDASWNPLAGCTPISPGCTHCYAATMARRLAAIGQRKYAGTAERRGSLDVFTGRINLDEASLTIPLRWKKPKRIFVNSMSDLFHEDVPFEFIDRVFAVMNMTQWRLPLPADLLKVEPWHTYQVLTKRPERAAEYSNSRAGRFGIGEHPLFRCRDVAKGFGSHVMNASACLVWPLANVWLGTSVEDQRRADQRIPHLLQAQAAVRFLSIEPLLEGVDLRGGIYAVSGHDRGTTLEGLDWVIVGGESGSHARPMHPDWVRFIRDQCAAAGVPFFFKQWGTWEPIATVDGRQILPFGDYNVDTRFGFKRVGKKAAGRLLDGVEHNGYPEVPA